MFAACQLSAATDSAIPGRGVIEGLPALVEGVALSVRDRALNAASEALQVLPAQLHGDAGMVGAAALAMPIQEVHA